MEALDVGQQRRARREPSVVARARVHRHVAIGAAVVDLVGVADRVREPTGSGIDMHRAVEHRRIVPEDRLCAIAVMGIDVDDGDPRPTSEAELGGGDRRVVEVAAATEERRSGVVTRRAAHGVRRTLPGGHETGSGRRCVGCCLRTGHVPSPMHVMVSIA